MPFQRVITSQDTVVTINGTSRIAGGESGDTVNIDTVVQLSSPEAQELNLVLPSVTADPQRAYIRTIDELDNRAEFQAPVSTALLDTLSDGERQSLEEAIAANKEQWQRIKDMTSSVQLTKIDLKQGDQELKFFLHKTLQPDANGIYELSFIAPFSNFSLQAGFSMSLIIVLPRDAVPVSDPEVVNPTGGPTPQMMSSESKVRRHIFQYWIQHDPIFTLRYHY